MAGLKMNKTLDDIKLIDLMPLSLRQDQQIIDICETIDVEMVEVKQLIAYSAIYARIDDLPESVIEALAWENKMLGPEWAIAKTRAKRIELVKNSFVLNKKRGTRWAVERIFSIIGMRAEIVEWWEEDAEPYTFRISVLDVSETGFTPEIEQWVTSLIYAYKPLSRHIKGTTLQVKSSVTDTRVAVASRFKIKFKGV